MSGYGTGGGPQQGDPWSSGGYEDQFNRAYGVDQGRSTNPGTQHGDRYGGPQSGASYGGTQVGGSYGAGSYGHRGPNPYGGGGVMPPRTARSTTGPKILTFIGVGLIVVAIVAAVVAAVSIGRLVESADLETVGPSGVQITASAGQEWALYSTRDGSAEWQTQSCTVTAPDGTDVALTAPGGELSINDYQLGHRFDTVVAGTYTVTCDQTAFVGHNIATGAVLGSIGGIIGAVFGGIVGIIMLIAGGVWWMSRRR